MGQWESPNLITCIEQMVSLLLGSRPKLSHVFLFLYRVMYLFLFYLQMNIFIYIESLILSYPGLMLNIP